MYELRQVGAHCYYVDCPAKVGIVETGEGEVCLIDGGSDKDAGRRVRKILDERGWRLRAIYNTHSHADHIGGNRYLQGQTGCRIFAPDVEAAFARHPLLEPALVFGGYPPKDLRHKFLMAQASDAEPLTSEALPEGWECVELPGHYVSMVGFRTPDDVVYLADCLSSERTLEKYGLSYLFDVGAFLETLERVRGMHAAMFVPAHADATEDIAPLAEANIAKVREVAERIVEICLEPKATDELVSSVFGVYGLRMSFEQYALISSTVRSYLAYLRDLGRIDVIIEPTRLLWHAKSA